MNHGKNAKEEIFKLHSMIEDYNNQSKREESLIFNEQLNNSMTYFSQENILVDPKRTSLDAQMINGLSKGPFRQVNKKNL